MLRAAVMTAESDDYRNRYTVAYDREEIQFPVWILMIFGGVFFYASVAKGSVTYLLMSAVFASLAYYSYPLLETGRVRLAADRDGLFIEGLGHFAWRAIGAIDAVELVVRGNVYTEAEISLLEPLAIALGRDAPKVPLRRRLMRKPFYLTSRSKVRVPLDIFDRTPEDIIGSLRRIWLFNRGRAANDR
ncbi:hypothetical protein [Hyphomicrobium sp. 99]|uniref:hypothetical protein n=1 Tax=Hyphomicrobium sp. 99 TaxID=1163419 RepID=UPI0012DFF3D3|nr:hypothetical protein [Hyphomicrobium sp. 99]